ncbi:SpoIIE family protein phosphatase [Streptomyces sp. NPDC002766]|uniref:SpoIIE family protein phosphatase n=1 Tax=unclassified Streptomyces TaxID=2593676 RepID=UPI00332F0B46
MFVWQIVVMLLLVATALAALVLQAQRQSTREARARAVSAAEMFANSPGVVEALDSRDPTAVLQPRAEAARKKADVDYVVVQTTKGIRYTQPKPELIGKHVVGSFDKTLAAAKEGKTFTEIIDAPQGRAVDANAPILRPDGSLAGIVSVGITIDRVDRRVSHQIPVLLGGAAVSVLLVGGGTGIVSRRLRRQTHGLGPVEMTRMYEHHDAVLHAVREGVVIVGGDGRLVLANDEARRLLNLPDDVEGRSLTDLRLDAGMAGLLESGREATDEVHLAGDRLLAVNVRPTAPDAAQAGRVATLRDTTELATVSQRADVARERLSLLYDAGVRIGTTLDVTRTAEELSAVAVPQFAEIVTVDLADAVSRGIEPTWQTTEMRRVSLTGIVSDPPLYPVGRLIRFVDGTAQAAAMASGRGVLMADLHAQYAWRTQDPERAAKVLDHGIHSLISVPLQARGVVLGMVDFWRAGASPAFDGEDLSFAEELAARAAVSLDNARRFTREHEMAVTLQQSLLPQGVPQQNAVEVAWRYLPAEAGVGGDWFDVIPLPGARVALVVGDVVGHGLHAAATMGRLRTAVHNFSALDLTPDELLAHLDDLVARMDSEAGAPEGSETHDSAAVTGATCLYAIYDPATGLCTAARAGHPGPAIMYPDGTVTHPEIPASLPLGLGGHPFETCELRLPKDSQLVLYTDGLVEDRERDIDVGLDALTRVLESEVGRTPEETCQAVVAATLPEHPSDDIALLVARTQLLEPTKVARWDVPPDPAVVTSVRAQCAAQLRTWGLEDIGFASELILSELVTNAIRYGTPPIRVRLLYDRYLICEVSDTSSTSPHLRRAKTTDEGGRGLFLVAQFAQRWGTRYTARGKVIWTEQSLHEDVATAETLVADALLDQFDDSAW